jgi:endogenous inhibitor of DNA gyrase (YacG/DUF329 family)
MSVLERSTPATPSLSCKQCGTLFHRSPAQRGAGFCSLRCFGDSKILPKKKCVDCSAETAWGSESRCRECWIKHVKATNTKGELRPCAQCGKEVYRSQSSLKATARRFGVFCSAKCFGLFVTGPKNPAYYSGRKPGQYPSAFKTSKRIVLEREKNACFLCFDGGKLDVHHIDRDKKNNAILNLVALCRMCHRKQENDAAAARLFTLLIERYPDQIGSTT